MKDASPSRSRRGSIRLLLVGVFVLALAAAILLPIVVSRTSMMQGTASDTAARLTSASPGAQIKIVCEITARPSPQLLEGIVLEANGRESYRRMGQSGRIQISPGQEVIMGSQQDLRKGVVIEVQGHLDQEKVIQSNQIVILTS